MPRARSLTEQQSKIANDNDNAEIVRRIFLIMKRHDVSQNEIAPHLLINQTAISAWHHRGALVTAVYLSRFPKAFAAVTNGVLLSERWLLTGEGEPYRREAAEPANAAALQGELTALAQVEEMVSEARRKVSERLRSLES